MTADIAHDKAMLNHICLALIALAACNPAFAQCPMADAVTARYGVSFSGFTQPIAIVSPAQRRALEGAGMQAIALGDTAAHVADGFIHLLLIDTARRTGYLARRGGFVGVDAWYGPITLPQVALTGCKFEPVLGMRHDK